MLLLDCDLKQAQWKHSSGGGGDGNARSTVENIFEIIIKIIQITSLNLMCDDQSATRDESQVLRLDSTVT